MSSIRFTAQLTRRDLLQVASDHRDQLRGRTTAELQALNAQIDEILRDEFTERGQIRDLTDAEQGDFDELINLRDSVTKRLTAHQALGEAYRRNPGGGMRAYAGLESERDASDPYGGLGDDFERVSGGSPWLVSTQHLREHADAIRGGSVFGTREPFVETRARITAAADLGSPGDWGANRIPGPVTMRQFAGIPTSPLKGRTATVPSFTLPASAAGADEGTNSGEYDTIDPAALTALRYGRWSEVGGAADVFDDLASISDAHAIGIARDINKADATALETAAGAAVAFTASIDQNLRTAILTLAGRFLVDPTRLVITGTGSDLALVLGYTPASGEDRGSVATRYNGAAVYVNQDMAAGFVTVFYPGSFRAFATGLGSASVIAPESGAHKFGQWLHSTPIGVAIVGGAIRQDVVTP